MKKSHSTHISVQSSALIAVLEEVNACSPSLEFGTPVLWLAYMLLALRTSFRHFECFEFDSS